ncbi:MAG: hypothetical protein KIT17_00705 [Rubrivivax sp.]|nr:hypothetical protein [Rubrivivax sp.]
MNMTASTLMWSVVFGSLGAGYCMYGYRQRAWLPGVCGVLLIVLPYLVTQAYALVAVCTLVAAAPFFVRR